MFSPQQPHVSTVIVDESCVTEFFDFSVFLFLSSSHRNFWEVLVLLAGKYSKAPAQKIFPIILSLTKVRAFVRMLSFVFCLSYYVHPFEHALRPSGMSSKAENTS